MPDLQCRSNRETFVYEYLFTHGAYNRPAGGDAAGAGGACKLEARPFQQLITNDAQRAAGGSAGGDATGAGGCEGGLQPPH